MQSCDKRRGESWWASLIGGLVPASTKALPFKAGDLLKHTAEDGELRRALIAAAILNTAEMGAWLRDHQGTHDGVTITRLPRRQWQASVVDQFSIPGRHICL